MLQAWRPGTGGWLEARTGGWLEARTGGQGQEDGWRLEAEDSKVLTCCTGNVLPGISRTGQPEK